MKDSLIRYAKELGERAIYTWGPKAQMIKACEELAELTQQLCKKLNDNPHQKEADIIDEIADVFIMTMQMRSYFNELEVDLKIQEKLTRLERALITYEARRQIDLFKDSPYGV